MEVNLRSQYLSGSLDTENATIDFVTFLIVEGDCFLGKVCFYVVGAGQVSVSETRESHLPAEVTQTSL